MRAPAAASAYDLALGRARSVAIGMAAVLAFGVAGSPISASARNTGQVQRPLGVQQLVIARADATGSLAGHFASNAVDGDSRTTWAGCGQGSWLRLDLGRAETIEALNVLMGADNPGYRLAVQTANDATGRAWTTISKLTSKRGATRLRVRLSPARSARFVRLRGLSRPAMGSGCRLRVAEVHVVGRPGFSTSFETGSRSDLTGLECGDPARQFAIVRSPVRRGRFAARFSERPGDLWPGNRTVRCLAVNGQTDEREGDDSYYTMSLYFPRPVTNNLLWETHSYLYRDELPNALSSSPNAILAVGRTPWYNAVANRLVYRLESGTAVWSGSGWSGWSDSVMGATIASPIPIKRWVDLIVHIRYSYNGTGLVQVWERAGSQPWPRKPRVDLRNVPTLQTIPGGLSASVPQALRSLSLYDEFGLYKGSALASQRDVVVLDAYGIWTSLAYARAYLARRQ